MSRASHAATPSPSSQWRGKFLVATTVVVSGCALYGFSLASDPETYQSARTVTPVALPCEDDYRRAADASHNERVFKLRQMLADRGFLLNGTQQVSANPLAVLRGTYGLVSPEDDRHACEWRLMATRAPTCQPCCYLRLEDAFAGFSPSLANALAHEWSNASDCLPPALLESGRSLLDQLEIVWNDDCDAADGEGCLAGDVIERRWIRHKQSRRYQLRLRQVAGDYEVEAQLCDRSQPEGRSCEVALTFKWLAGAPAQMAQRQ